LIDVGAFTHAAVITLSDIKNGVKTTIRFYVRWANNDNNNEIDSLYGRSSATFDIPMEITFRQYTGENIATPSPTPTEAATSNNG
jgi:hypothetical protein